MESFLQLSILVAIDEDEMISLDVKESLKTVVES
jgi:hypothetical protein